jgi:cell division protein FtsB
LNVKYRKLWKSILIALGCLFPVLAWVGLGERGLLRLYRTEAERQACLNRIHKLVKENQALIQEIESLRGDMEYVEAVARKELGLIKPNEVIYRIGDKEISPENDPGQLSPARNKQPEAESEVHNEGIVR